MDRGCRRSCRSSAWWGALAVVLVRMAVGAKPAEEPPAARFGETVEVRVVNVEVFVSDRQGRPVTDLRRDEVELFEDGRAVAITHFYASAAGARAGAEPSPEPSTTAGVGTPATANEGEATAPTSALEASSASAELAAPPLHLAVLLDDLHLAPAHRARTLDALEPFLVDQVRRGGRVLVASYDRGLALRGVFTEPAEVTAELARLRALPTHGLDPARARRQALERIRQIHSDLGCGEGLSLMMAEAANLAGPTHHETRTTLAAIQELVSQLAGLPGRRALLYVSDGLPLVAGEEAYQLVDELCSGSSAFSNRRDSADLLRRVTAAANAARVTLYSLQAAGLPVGGSAEGMGPELSPAIEFAARGNQQDTLFNLATETGGQALLDSNRLAPFLGRLREDLESFYSLGFSPARRGDGREHRLEVKVRRPGLRVRFRSAYVDRAHDDLLREQLMAVLRFGGGDNPLALRAVVGPHAAGQGRPGHEVPVHLEVPIARLLLVPEPGAARGGLRVWFAVRDAAGRTSEIRSVEVPIVVADEELDAAQSGVWRYVVRMRLAQGPHVAVLAVEDVAAQAVSVLRVDVGD